MSLVLIPRVSRRPRAGFPAACVLIGIAAAALCVAAIPSASLAQSVVDGELDSFVRQALAVNPAIHAAEQRTAAARARISAAGGRPEPMLMAGVVNLPIKSLSFSDDEMTMKMIGIEQVFPYRGKLGLRERVAKRETDAAAAAADSVRLATVREVKSAYYELAYVDQALAITEQNRGVLMDIVSIAQGRYSVGRGTQQEVLRATLEATRLNESANALRQERASALAQLNSLLNRPSETEVASPKIPQRIAAAAVSQSGTNIRFTSQSLGASVADSPLPSLTELRALATERSPVLRASEAMISAKTTELELARKDFLPDIGVSLQYGQRSGYTSAGHGVPATRSDMISAVVSIPIPLQKRRNQDALVSSAGSELAALESDKAGVENSVRVQVARLYADIEHSRTQLALYVKAILPQGRATLASATGNYQSGTGDLIAVLNAQGTIFDYETGYYRALTDFAQKIAELDALVGKEVLR